MGRPRSLPLEHAQRALSAGSVDGLIDLARKVYDGISRHFDEAMAVLVDTMNDPEASARDRITAAKAILDLSAKAAGVTGTPGEIFREAVNTLVLDGGDSETARVLKLVDEDANYARNILTGSGDIDPDGNPPPGG